MDVFTIIISSAVVVAIINWVRELRSEKRERKINFLDRQIRELYAPVYYFTSQAEKFFELNRKFHTEYEREYMNKEWSQDVETQKSLDSETKNIIEVANKYIEYIKNNNTTIQEIISKNYSLIDLEDIEIFLLLTIHNIRRNTEFSETGKLRLPLKIYINLEQISILSPEIILKIKEIFFKKKIELKKLLEYKKFVF